MSKIRTEPDTSGTAARILNDLAVTQPQLDLIGRLYRLEECAEVHSVTVRRQASLDVTVNLTRPFRSSGELTTYLQEHNLEGTVIELHGGYKLRAVGVVVHFGVPRFIPGRPKYQQ